MGECYVVFLVFLFVSLLNLYLQVLNVLHIFAELILCYRQHCVLLASTNVHFTMGNNKCVFSCNQLMCNNVDFTMSNTRTVYIGDQQMKCILL